MAGLDVVQTGAWMLPDPTPLPDELESFLDEGAPPVYVGFGSMPMSASKDVARVVIEAIRAQGRRAIVSRGWADLALIDDRDDCFVVGEVNQQALFRRVGAVVHHGGAGTTTTAACAGVPQIVVPQIADQAYWAGRLAELGIGVAHEGPRPTLESLTGFTGTVVLHCFSSPALLETALDRAYYVSFAGNVTYPKAADLRECAALVPAARP